MILAAALTAVLAANADVYALVIGHNGGAEGLPALRFADDDALRMARTFSAVPGHQQTWVLARPDDTTRATLSTAGLSLPVTREPTRAALFAARDELKAKLNARPAERRATVYLFYAGHSANGQLLLEGGGITGEELKLLAATLPADDVVLFVDACRAQSLFTARGATGPDLSARIDALEEKAARLGVLAAAQSNQPAGETDRLQGGFFSHVLASGILGGADADNAEVVRFGELAAFVAFHTERVTGQQPWFEPPGGDLRAPTVSLRGATRLRLAEDTAGRLQVSSIAGVPFFAEVNKPKGRAVRLALPAGRYHVVQNANGTRGTADVELTAGEEQPLTAIGFTAGASVSERGLDDEGFSSPFTPSVVAALDAGFVSGREPSLASGSWRHALDVAYELSPAPTDPHQAWELHELYDPSSGRLYEIDLLFLSRQGLFLVEIKSHPGVLTGDIVDDRQGPGGPDWPLLIELVTQATDRVVDDLLKRRVKTLLLAWPGALARYGLAGALSRIALGAEHGDAPAILLVVPSHNDGAAPSINGRLPVPAPLPSQRLVMPDAWLANAHKAAETP